MNQDEAFLHDICEHPEDDTPRLVYADWLDEHGDPDRANFIRVQCTLARLDEDDPAKLALEKQEQSLLARHGAEWCLLLPKWVKDGQFRRGFVAEVAVTADHFLRRAEDLWRRAPVEGVHLKRAVGHEQALLASHHLNRLTFLGLHDAAVVLALAGSSPHLTRLASLSVSHRRLDQETVGLATSLAPALAASPNLPALTGLQLTSAVVGLGGAGAEALANAPQRSGLLSLDFSPGNFSSIANPDNRVVAALAAATCLPRLTSLNLGTIGIDVEGLRALANSSCLPGLRSLDLGDTAIDVEGVRALAEGRLLAQLHALTFVGRSIGTGGVEVLARSPHAANLRKLVIRSERGALSRSKLTSTAIRALAASPYLANLRVLSLANKKLDDKSAMALVDSPHLTNLVRLNLEHNEIGPEPAAALQHRFGEGVQL
jgi:uncharacterized protein (TIGR02996 family)